MNTDNTESLESPDAVRMSLAAAMTLGFKNGLFYRNARLYCINLLLTYRQGCAAKCAYCGLSSHRPGRYEGESFIRVPWPIYPLDDIVESISARKDRVKRICISMITHKRAVQDTKDVCRRLRSAFDIPVSLLISPSILGYDDLVDFKAAGADKIGVAVDAATPYLFDKFRGSGVGGPHKWERYWQCLTDAIGVFGNGNAGAHFMVGMGETEKEMCEALQRVRDAGGMTHLFSFFPEANSRMAEHVPPPMDQYRRIQLARYLIDVRYSRTEAFDYDEEGRIVDFGLSRREVDEVIDSGEPFRTSGCEGYDGQVACNRPFANSRPGPLMRNYPFAPTREDVLRIRKQFETSDGDDSTGDQ